MKSLICISLILILVCPSNFIAENVINPFKMEELAIQVMPEYSYRPKETKKNHPPLLIGYQGIFINTSEHAQKGKMEIPLPTGLKDLKVGFVAESTRNLSEMDEIEYELDKELGTITWETTNEIKPRDLYKFVIEFYSNAIQEQSELKSLDYTFKSFTDIGLVSITFLEPLKTESTKLNPAPETHHENPYGMNLFIYQFSSMKTDEQKTFELTYKRSSSKTTVELLNQMNFISEEIPEPQKVNSNELFMVIGGVGVFSIVSTLLLIVFLKKKKRKEDTSVLLYSVSINQEDQRVLLRNKLVQGEITKEDYHHLVRKMK
jgi:uncharacterized membrane protein